MSGFLTTGTRSRRLAAGVLAAGLLGGLGFAQTANGAPTGPNGTPGPDQHRAIPTAKAGCSKYWVVVNRDGTPARGSCGVKTSKKLFDGQYQINWTRSERLCGRFATIGLPGSSGTETPGFITTVGRAGKPKSTFVGTYDVDGNFEDRAFQVHLSC
jgi:hypothetical protein